MKLGIMQPYFLPYLGYFSLIKHTDKWVVFDTVQYKNRAWINRNRILSESKDGISYITVPVVRQSRNMLISDTLIDNSQKWREKINGQITFYKKKAPFYDKTKSILDKILNYDTSGICELNIMALKIICEYINIEFKYSLFSENTMGINTVNAPDEWALEISKQLGARTYINPPGGKSFFNKKKYDIANINLKFLTQTSNPYQTFNSEFISGLSIIDVMMFNSPKDINKMLDNYELE